MRQSSVARTLPGFLISSGGVRFGNFLVTDYAGVVAKMLPKMTPPGLTMVNLTKLKKLNS